ncbi:hypothetical protein [Gymnodinialimonas sp.]
MCDDEPTKEEKWKKQAWSKFKGFQFLWIDQGASNALKRVDSSGVCFALTRDYVDCCRTSKTDVKAFTDAFRAVQQKEDPDTVPEKYITLQAQYVAALKADNLAVGELSDKLETADDTTKPTKAELVEQLKAIRLRKFRMPATGYGVIKSSLVALEDSIRNIKEAAAEGPAYFMLSFFKPGKGGHVVGFEYRPDLTVNKLLPKRFTFIDANLGLYFFKDFEQMLDFFYLAVWTEIYNMRDYTRFEIAMFDKGSIAPDETETTQ